MVATTSFCSTNQIETTTRATTWDVIGIIDFIGW
jgi:hypothetical protein